MEARVGTTVVHAAAQLRRRQSLAPQYNAQAPTTVYFSVLIIQMSEINPARCSFKCRFDLFVHWDSEYAHEHTGQGEHVHVDKETLGWLPIIRFPNADEYSEYMRMHEVRPALGMAGYRTTMQGTFKCVQNLRNFPFDVQAMTIECQLGRELNTGTDLCMPQFRAAHNPHIGNRILVQVDAEWYHRPVRYRISRTANIEGSTVFPKYVIIIPCERNSRYYLNNIYVIPFFILLMSTGVFAVPLENKGERLTLTATVFLVLVAYKFSINEQLPNVPYYTQLDRYMTFSMLCIFMTYMIDIYPHTPQTQRLWIIATIVLIIFSHLYFIYEVRHHATKSMRAIRGSDIRFYTVRQKRRVFKVERNRVKDMGIIDEQLKKMLEANHIKLNPDGTIMDPEKYFSLMDDGDGSKIEEGLNHRPSLENIGLTGARSQGPWVNGQPNTDKKRNSGSNIGSHETAPVYAISETEDEIEDES